MYYEMIGISETLTQYNM